jgi:hypothetical protein
MVCTCPQRSSRSGEQPQPQAPAPRHQPQRAPRAHLVVLGELLVEAGVAGGGGLELVHHRPLVGLPQRAVPLPAVHIVADTAQGLGHAAVDGQRRLEHLRARAGGGGASVHDPARPAHRATSPSHPPEGQAQPASTPSQHTQPAHPASQPASTPHPAPHPPRGWPPGPGRRRRRAARPPRQAQPARASPRSCRPSSAQRAWRTPPGCAPGGPAACAPRAAAAAPPPRCSAARS